MANCLQKFLYNLSNVVPLLTMTALIWYIQYKKWFIPIVLFGVAICISIMFAIFFSYGKNNCSIKAIDVTSISSKDSWLAAYVIAYLLPFTSMMISDFNIVSTATVIVVLVLIIMSSVMAVPNILLFFMGYHFYEINTEESNGISDYLLITKRKRVRNKTDVKTAMRMFEKLLIDTKEDS